MESLATYSTGESIPGFFGLTESAAVESLAALATAESGNASVRSAFNVSLAIRGMRGTAGVCVTAESALARVICVTWFCRTESAECRFRAESSGVVSESAT